MDRDKNLLFGILAVQLRRVTPAQLVEAAALWLADPSQSLADRLVQLEALSVADRETLDNIAEFTLKLHKDDAVQAYASLRGYEEWQRLLAAAPPTKARETVSTILGMPLDVKHADTGRISAVEETPGRYSRTSEYARGGMGRILLVHDQYLDRDIALKELLPFDTVDETQPTQTPVRASAQMIGRFLREARVTGQLEHPSIVPVYELGRRPNGTLYYTMKLVRGKTLSSAILGARKLRDRLELLPHIIGLCHAIAYAHERRVIHRDIKPSNVMIGGFGETVVIDWGLAKIVGQEDIYAEDLRATWSRLSGSDEIAPPETDPGAALGTPHYMAPEQAGGYIDAIDERSDIYALGAVLYEVLTGKVPFDGRTTHEILEHVVTRFPKPVLELQPDAPQELAGICAKAMEKDPDRRYQSAKELADDIIRFQAGALVRSYRYSPRELLVHYYRKHRAVWNTAAVGIIALIAVTAVSYVNILQARNREHAQRIVAEQARDAEQQAREQAEAEAYTAHIRAAGEYVRVRNFATADQELQACAANLRNWEWGYLYNRCHQDVRTLAGHTGRVYHVEFSPDGVHALSLGGEEYLRIWDTDTGEEVQAIRLPELIRWAEYSPDGRYIAVATHEGAAILLDAARGDEVVRFEGHKASLPGLSFNSDGSLLATSSNDGTVRVWDTASGELRATHPGQAPVQRAEFVSNGSAIIARDSSGTLTCWKYPEGTLAYTVACSTAAAAPGMPYLAVARGRDVVLCDLATGQTLRQIYVAPSRVIRLRFHPTAGLLLVVPQEGGVALLDVESGNVLQEWKEEESIISGGFSPDGAAVLVQYQEGVCRVWNTESGSLERTIEGHSGAIRSVAWASDSHRLITGGFDHLVKVWDLRRPQADVALPAHTAAVSGVAFDPDGARVATIDADGDLSVFSVAPLRKTIEFACGGGQVGSSVAFVPGTSRIVATVDRFTPIAIDLKNSANASVYGNHVGRVAAVATAPDGTAVASASWDNSIHVWNPADGSDIAAFTADHGGVVDVAFSPAGDRIVSVSDDGTAQVWSIASGAEVNSFEVRDRKPTCIDFSPDGTAIATGGGEGVRIWDSESGDLEGEMSGQTSDIVDLAFNLNGTRLATAARDRSVVIWDVAAKCNLLNLSSFEGEVNAVQFSPKGDWLLAGDENGILHIFDAGSGYRSGGSEAGSISVAGPTIDVPDVTSACFTDEVTVLAAPSTATQCLQYLAQKATADNAGEALRDPQVAAPLRPLGLRQGDIFNAFSVDGATWEGVESLTRALTEVDARAGATFGIGIERRGHPRILRVRLLQPVDASDEVVIPVDVAKAVLSALRETMERDWETVTQVQQATTDRYGLGEPGKGRSPVLWLPSAANRSEKELYLKLHLAAGDGIRLIDSPAVATWDDGVKAIDGWEQMILRGEPIQIRLAVIRGAFQVRDLILHVR